MSFFHSIFPMQHHYFDVMLCLKSAASQVNAAKTALNGDNNLRVAKEHANNTIDGLAQLNNVQKA
ncbi:hypothetical protein ACO1JD_04790, partial [Staphylococcus aureus]